MHIEDIIYGSFDVDDRVLIEVMNSKPVQRLKRISQAGASKYVLPNRNGTRYEHSVGVMLLLRKLGACIEEQLAGLMHDIPHTAFSHVVDFLFKRSEHQDFHEQFHEKIILNSEIPEIIEKHGYDINRLLDESNFPLLERSIPDLCADRIDYTLRDAGVSLGKLDYVREIPDRLVVHNDEIVFDDAESAKKFGELYLEADYKLWSNPVEVAAYYIMAEALEIALDEGIITENDFFATDDYIYDKLASSENKLINEKLSLLSMKFKVVEDENDYDFYSRSKVRYVNPKYINSDGVARRVGEMFPDFEDRLKEHNERMAKGFYLKVLQA